MSKVNFLKLPVMDNDLCLEQVFENFQLLPQRTFHGHVARNTAPWIVYAIHWSSFMKTKYTHRTLTLILLTWRIWWAPNNASRWQMGFNLAFKGLTSENRNHVGRNFFDHKYLAKYLPQ